MALHWIKATDRRDAPDAPKYDANVWLLMSGQSREFVIGRVLRTRSGPHAGRFSWSLTGVLGAMVGNVGETESLEAAQDELLASWRRWQDWAGVQDRV
jgi:hypothetical protein